MVIASQRMGRRRLKGVRRGSEVSLALGGTMVRGVVVVDHGPIGPGGVRLLRVRFDFADGLEPLEGDVREDSLTPLDLAAVG